MNTMKRTLTTCLLLALLCPLAFSQDKASKERDAAKDLAERKAALQSTDADLPIVEEAKMSINITSKKNQFYGGEPITVDTTLTNNGNGNPVLMQYPVEMLYDIQVIDSLGLPVESLPSRSMRRYGGSTKTITLRHNESLSGWLTLSNLFDMSLNGTYKVKVSKRFRLQKTKEPVTISSNTLTIEVTSDSPTSGWHSYNEANK